MDPPRASYVLVSSNGTPTQIDVDPNLTVAELIQEIRNVLRWDVSGLTHQKRYLPEDIIASNQFA